MLGIDEQTGFSEVNWGAWETNWTSEAVTEATWEQTTETQLGTVDPKDLPPGTDLSQLKHIANYGMVNEVKRKMASKRCW